MLATAHCQQFELLWQRVPSSEVTHCVSSPDFSRNLGIVDGCCARVDQIFQRHAWSWRRDDAVDLGYFLSWRMISVGQRRCRGDRACGEACQAGEARARGANASRTAAKTPGWAAGPGGALGKLMRGNTMGPEAPAFSKLDRMGTQGEVGQGR